MSGKREADLSIIQKTLQTETVRKSIQDYKLKVSGEKREEKDKQSKEREQLAAKYRAINQEKKQQQYLNLNPQQQKLLMQTIPEKQQDDGTAKNSRQKRYESNNYTFEDIEKMDYRDLNKATLTARAQDNQKS